MTRSNMFADLSFNFPILKIIAEIGQVSGGTAPSTVNTFPSKGIVDSRLYGCKKLSDLFRANPTLFAVEERGQGEAKSLYVRTVD